MKILIIDDSTDILELTSAFLQPTCECITANQHNAMNVFLESKPDVCIIDICMPGRDGYDILRDILMMEPDAKCIMFSGNNNEDIIRKCLTIGARAYLVKPFNKETLKYVIKQVYENKKPCIYELGCVVSASLKTKIKEKEKQLSDALDLIKDMCVELKSSDLWERAKRLLKEHQ